MLKHITVLKNESIDALKIKPNGIYVDATLGGAGHSLAILKKLKSGFLYCFEQDEFAISKAKEVLKDYQNFKIFPTNFANMTKSLASVGISKVDGILFDLGLSSFQIDDQARGFSYMSDDKLDMRMDKTNPLTAEIVVNEYEFEDLLRVLKEYGEEKNAFKIAKEIFRQRPIQTTHQLVKICDKVNFDSAGHSAKRVFQALRIEVNNELGVLNDALGQVIDLLNPKGRLAVITFHSLEDKIVKHFIKKNSELNLPKNIPLINIAKPPLINVSKASITPSMEEKIQNPRSRSARLRVAEKV